VIDLDNPNPVHESSHPTALCNGAYSHKTLASVASPTLHVMKWREAENFSSRKRLQTRVSSPLSL
jgi:hypothetical protein